VDLSDPRAVKTRNRILQVTSELMVESGLQAITMETIAKRAEISRSTLYRHWPQLTDLIIDVIEHVRPTSPRVLIDNPVERLRAMIEALGAALRSHPWGPISAALAEGGARDPVLGELHARYTRARRRPALAAVRDGQRCGSIPADVNPEWLVNVLAGPLYYHHLVLHRPLTAPQVAAHLEYTLNVLGIDATAMPMQLPDPPFSAPGRARTRRTPHKERIIHE
jgi:AcrR family transcriptional regulator